MRIKDWSSGVCSSDLAGGEQGVLCGGGGHGGLGGRLVGGGGGAGFGSLAIARREGEADGSGKDERSQHGGSPAHGPAGPEAVKGNAGADPLACAIGRSEEHTSELQSLMRISYAVFCLQKKNSLYQNVNK